MSSSEDKENNQSTQSDKGAHRPAFRLVIQTDDKVTVLYAHTGFRVDSLVNNGSEYEYKATRLYGARTASGLAKMRGMGRSVTNVEQEPDHWLSITDDELIRVLRRESPWTSARKTSDRLRKASQAEQGPGTSSISDTENTGP